MTTTIETRTERAPTKWKKVLFAASLGLIMGAGGIMGEGGLLSLR